MSATVTADHWPCTNHEYHADKTYLSASGLKCFLKSIPEYYGRYVTGEIPQDTQTPSMILGSALHCLVLEGPEAFDAQYIVPPKCDRRTKEGKAMFEEFARSHAGKTFLTEDQLTAVKGMDHSIRMNSAAWTKILDCTHREYSIRYECDITGIQCKTRFDGLSDSGTFIDLKTTSDPSPDAFVRQSVNLGYDIQAAFYVRARDAFIGPVREPVYHIVVGTSPPYDCIVYRMQPEVLALGMAKITAGMVRLARCIDTDDWSGEYQNRVIDLTYPAYAYKE